MRKIVWFITLVLVFNTFVFSGARKTKYPVVFAHGLAGFDNILGYDYWGDDMEYLWENLVDLLQ